MRNRFDRQLAQLNRELTEMGALCEEVIALASRALTEGDKTLAAKVAPVDAEIDEKERSIESLCLKLLLQQQPVARDLRQISAALKMITDMERIGDQAADISGLVIYIANEPYIKELTHLPQMGKTAIQMVRGSLDAFVHRDLTRAREVMAMDDEVDALFTTIKDELIERIREDASVGSQAVDLLMIAKYYERIGDHAQNIAEWVEYALTGRHKGVYLT